jgi:hypothetical protein
VKRLLFDHSISSSDQIPVPETANPSRDLTPARKSRGSTPFHFQAALRRYAAANQSQYHMKKRKPTVLDRFHCSLLFGFGGPGRTQHSLETNGTHYGKPQNHDW